MFSPKRVLVRFLLVMMMGGLLAVPPANTLAFAGSSSSSPIQHIFLVVMENKSYSSVWNKSSTPYITGLGNSYARATNYSAITHPSLPNYLALVGGSTFGIKTNCSRSVSCHTGSRNLMDNLEARGLSWKAYMESMPSGCSLKKTSKYVPRHNPFIYFDNIINDGVRCFGSVVPYRNFSADLASTATTPNFAFITPNLCNDMHDCPVKTGDKWLKKNLPAMLNSPACTVDTCLVVLTWDEGGSGSNKVLTIFAGSAAQTGGVTSANRYNHYSLLRTIETIFGLPALTANDANASPMTDLLR